MSTRILFWQPVLTDHSAHTFLAAANHLGAEPTAFVAATEVAFRKGQGWPQANRVMPTYLVTDAEGAERAKTALEEPNAIHVFCSPFEKGPIAHFLHTAIAKKGRVFLVSEPYMTVPVGYNDDNLPIRDALKALLRPAVYRLHGRRLRDRTEGVFAISPLAVEQYKRLGFRAVYPFGYFLPASQLPEPIARSPSTTLRLAYVGSTIRRKNIEGLLQAMEVLGEANVSLDIFASTARAGKLSRLPNVKLAGRIPFGETPKVLTRYDVLVAPSLHDGWGMAVNEAIMAGCAVIASEETGSAILIETFRCGLTFPATKPPKLVEAIVRLARDRALLAEMMNNARSNASLVTSELAGMYMAARMNRQMVKAPWYA